MIQCELQTGMALKISSPISCFSKFHLNISEFQNFILAVK